MKPAQSRGLVRRRLLEQLQLLCDCGAGLEAIAGPVCRVTSDLLGLTASSLFWVDEHGAPAGFYHQTATTELKELFASRFEDLFSGPDQENFITVLHLPGPLVGATLNDAYRQRFWSGNIYKHLAAPLGHKTFIDARVRIGDRPHCALLGWGGPDRAFSAADVALMSEIQAHLQRAAESRPAARWVALGSGRAHLVTDLNGRRLIAINQEAEDLLTNAELMRMRMDASLESARPPFFTAQLAGRLESGPVRETIPVANGRIRLEAARTKVIDAAGGREETMFVSVIPEAALDVLCIEYLAGCDLTFLQRRIALFGMTGVTKSECQEALGVSAEAMKKHCARIFEATGTQSWSGLAGLVEQRA